MLWGALYIAPPRKEDLSVSGEVSKYGPSKVRELAQMTAREAIKTKQFWMLWSMHLINVSAGLMMISVASPMAQEIVGLSVAAAAAMVGLMGLFNGGGRLLWAAASDYIGRSNVFIIFFVIQLVAFVTLPFTTNVVLFQLFIFLVVSCYGGGFSNLPAFASDLFGTKQLGVIHGYLLTTWSLGGVFGPMIVTAIRETTNSYVPVFYVFSVLIALSFVISIFLRIEVVRLRKKQVEEEILLQTSLTK